MSQTVIGFFDDSNAAQSAIDQLISVGFTRDQIDLSKGTETENISHKGDGDNGITRFFKSLIGDNDEDTRHTKIRSSGSTIVTVHAQSGDEAQIAADLLEDYGAIDVDERDAESTYTNGLNRKADADHQMDREASIPGMGHEYRTGNTTEGSSDLNTRNQYAEQPREESAQFREENVRREQNPMDSVASEKDLQSFREGTIELSERKEIPVVNKEARIVEEIRLQKETNVRDETIHENLRETRVDIDKMEGDELRNRNRFDSTTDLDYDIKKGYRVENKNPNQVNDANGLRDEENNDWDYGRKGRSGDPLFGA